MTEEFRQGYKTLSERAAERRALAQANLASLSVAGTQAEVRLNLWRVQSQRHADLVCYVRCPSRSGAKIFVNRERGWVGPFWTEIVAESDVPEGEEVVTAWFPTVVEEAEQYSRERK